MIPIRVLLVDDHELIRSGLRALLEKHPHITVVGEGASGEDALELTLALDPDIVLMDVSMPGLNGLEATAMLTAGRPPRRVIVLSAHSSPKFVRRALRAGARGYLLKNEHVVHLAAAVEEVHRGGTWFSSPVQDVIAGLVSDPRFMEADPIERLSRRQRAVLQLIAEGQSNREIAVTLGIGESTVDTHRTELMRRLDLHDIASVVRFACEEGLVGAV